MLDLVLNIWENADLTPNDAGWVLWVICDQYAIGRVNDPIIQYKYQSEFFNLVRSNFPERAHWVVSDSTQQISLHRGGFLPSWIEWYQFANDTAPHVPDNRRARFESHRANSTSFVRFGEFKHAHSALTAIAELLQEDDNWPSRQFATAMYKELQLEFYTATQETAKVEEIGLDIERMLDEWIRRVDGIEMIEYDGKPLFGSWQYFHEDWQSVKGYAVALNNAACLFAKAGRFPSAERLFRTWLDYRNRPLNEYGEALFLLSCWHNGHSREEIRRMFDESQTNSSVAYAIHIAPDLAEILG